MATCYIFAAGSFYGLTEYPSEGDFVIAADAGLKHCTEAWVAPDLILGCLLYTSPSPRDS